MSDPAFPSGAIRKSRSSHDPGAEFRITDITEPKYAGLDLRDYFAAKALLPLVLHVANLEDVDRALIAKEAYKYADEMLRARKKK